MKQKEIRASIISIRDLLGSEVKQSKNSSTPVHSYDRLINFEKEKKNRIEMLRMRKKITENSQVAMNKTK
jgi:hypothetical protein